MAETTAYDVVATGSSVTHWYQQLQLLPMDQPTFIYIYIYSYQSHQLFLPGPVVLFHSSFLLFLFSKMNVLQENRVFLNF